jgi:hypothetical protein
MSQRHRLIWCCSVAVLYGLHDSQAAQLLIVLQLGWSGYSCMLQRSAAQHSRHVCCAAQRQHAWRAVQCNYAS